MTGILLAILVAITWSIGEINYSKISKKYDRANVYLYSFFIRAIIYIGVVIFFQFHLIGTFNQAIFSSTLPIIVCDLLASLAINMAVTNGKLSIVSPIMAAYPMVDIILGTLLLQEKTSPLEIALVTIISISIVILAIHPEAGEKAIHPKKGILFSVLYMLLAAFSIYFEKIIYNSNYTVYHLYYYKGLVYVFASLFFGLVIATTSSKLKKPTADIVKGCSITPVGNIIDSFALSAENVSIVTPISSLYAVITHFISRFYLKEKVTLKEKICIGVIMISTITLILLKI